MTAAGVSRKTPVLSRTGATDLKEMTRPKEVAARTMARANNDLRETG
jgi:hypothetical protein